jgi:hypothetical protein
MSEASIAICGRCNEEITAIVDPTTLSPRPLWVCPQCGAQLPSQTTARRLRPVQAGRRDAVLERA